MSGKYILDSNIVIDLPRGDQKMISRIREIKEISIPVIVIGELCFGANKSSQTSKRLLEIQRLIELVTILNITKSTARIYGEIKEQLRTKGKPIPENDIGIAAIAKEANLPLLTKDKHFEYIDDFLLERM